MNCRLEPWHTSPVSWISQVLGAGAGDLKAVGTLAFRVLLSCGPLSYMFLDSFGPGPSGNCCFVKQIIIIIHLLGLAPAGYLAAPDNGPRAGCGVVVS
jgi:hypothetical protein